LASLLKRSKELGHAGNDILNSATEIHFQVYQYLVVPGSSAMDFFSGVANMLRQHKLYLRVDVFYPVFDSEAARFYFLSENPGTFFQYLTELSAFQEPGFFQHNGMGHGAQNIKRRQENIQFPVFSYR